jgi:uncharacterized RDD family membrane protein YckC
VNELSDVPETRAAYAGFWRRFAAYAIDYTLVFLCSAVLAIVALLAGFSDRAPQLLLGTLIIYFCYCALLESSNWQATVGKRVLRLKVTNLRGERIGFARAALRFVAELLSALTLCAGYLLVVVTRRRQALHDLIAGTLVAYDATRARPT